MTTWTTSLTCVISRYANNLPLLHYFCYSETSLKFWKKSIKHVALYNTSIWITHSLLTYIQRFLLLLPPNHRNKYSGCCLPSVHHTLNPVWLHCLEVDLIHHSRKAARNAQNIPVPVLAEWQPVHHGNQFCGQQHHLWWHIPAGYTNIDTKTKLLTQIPMWRIIDTGLLLL